MSLRSYMTIGCVRQSESRNYWLFWRFATSTALLRRTSRPSSSVWPTWIRDSDCGLRTSTTALVVPRTQHSTNGDRAFSVAAERVWNSLPLAVTLSPSLPTFKRKTELFVRSYSA